MKTHKFITALKEMMKLLYWLSITALICCNAIAASKPNLPELKCPYILPPEKDFPISWVVVGKAPNGKMQLRETSIIDGDAKEEKKRVLMLKKRIFSRDIIDEWESFGDRSEATAEYPANHRDMSIMCTYGRTQAESFDNNLNIVLLIPLPPKKPVSCLLTRRDVDPTHEISCNVK